MEATQYNCVGACIALRGDLAKEDNGPVYPEVDVRPPAAIVAQQEIGGRCSRPTLHVLVVQFQMVRTLDHSGGFLLLRLSAPDHSVRCLALRLEGCPLFRGRLPEWDFHVAHRT